MEESKEWEGERRENEMQSKTQMGTKRKANNNCERQKLSNPLKLIGSILSFKTNQNIQKEPCGLGLA
jgi:hypothetical protein